MIYYRYIIVPLAIPLMAVLLLFRLITRRETLADLSERLGNKGPDEKRGWVIWMHAASLGETTSARPLVEAILARDPRVSIVFTTASTSGRNAARSWNNPRVSARLGPIDTVRAQRRFHDAWNPVALVSVENEIWPNRFVYTHQRGVPVMIAGARLSRTATRNHRRLRRLSEDVFACVDHIAVQDRKTSQRLARLGYDRARLGRALNLKARVRNQPVGNQVIADYAQALPRDATLLAASTHPGEEDIIIDGFAEALRQNPRLRLILAPRHPDRGDVLSQRLGAAGLPCERRSTGGHPASDKPVYLADTLGEMALWYNLAGITFVGGSLIDMGGHTPFEPAQADSAILHGPYVANFADAYEALDEVHGAESVTDAKCLSAAMLALTSDIAAREAMVHRATEALQRLASEGAAIDAFVAKLGELTGNPALEGKIRL